MKKINTIYKRESTVYIGVIFRERDNEYFDFILIDATDYQSIWRIIFTLAQLSDTGFIMCHFHKERLQYAVNYFAKK